MYDRAAAFLCFREEPAISRELVKPTEREHAAATTIARSYRRYLTARQYVRKGVNAARAKWFALCREEAAAMGLSGKYRMLFLGPFPHALVCIEAIVNYAQEATQRLRDQLTTVQFADYEALIKAMDSAM